MLTGVRQCGKTYIVEEFAKESFQKLLGHDKKWHKPVYENGVKMA
ncbi:MAG: hypothetical protein K6G58_07935 [Lachnospiraceae bacterium]|nr:hypothetical protein [Lachnospiraceae bacterium]